MTPKEKANDLVFKFLRYSTEDCTDLYTGNPSIYKFRNAKQCALIAVDEILSVVNGYAWSPTQDYWQKVKTEIENL